MNEDIFNGLGVEVLLTNPENFLVTKETLTRIGVASKRSNTLYQSCHILHKRGRYAILTFKELFLLDGKRADIEPNDIQRRNMIAKLLEDWGLVSIINKQDVSDCAPLSQIKIISFADKEDWKLEAKYTIGKRKYGEYHGN